MRHSLDRNTASLAPPPPLPPKPTAPRHLETDVDVDLDIDIDVDLQIEDDHVVPDGARPQQQSWSGVPPIAQLIPVTQADTRTAAERRRSYRHQVALPVDLSVAGQRHRSMTRMLSLGGALVESPLRPAFNTRVELRFALPGQLMPIQVGATVRWSDERGFGVQFDGLRAYAVYCLGKFFERL